MLWSSAFLATLCAGFVFACGDDDSSSQPAADGGTDAPADNSTVDQSTPDTGVDAGGESPKIIMVNGAIGLGPVRICLGLATKADLSDQIYGMVPPLPDTNIPGAGLPFPGLWDGVGGPLPQLGTEHTYIMIPYLVSAQKLAELGQYKFEDGGVATDGGTPLTSCTAIIPQLTEGTDYIKIAPIPANTIKNSTTTMAVITGCPKSYEGDATKCGPGWNATTGNIELKQFTLDREGTVTKGNFGIQFIHAASAAVKLSEGGRVIPGFANADALGNFVPTLISATPVQYPSITPRQVANIAVRDGGYDFAGALYTLPDGGIEPVGLPTIYVEMFSGNSGPSYLKDGNRTTMILVGDPEEIPFIDPATGEPLDPTMGGIPNLKSIHPLIFENNPVTGP